MRAEIQSRFGDFKVDLSAPIDISMPLHAGAGHASAWYVGPARFEPVRMGDWVGEVRSGAPVNFRTVILNPHGNGTHTECVGHISAEGYTINSCLKAFFFISRVISIEPALQASGDRVITLEQVKAVFTPGDCEALAIRTLPNTNEKLSRNYSDTNPAYLDPLAAAFLKDSGINHLLIDLPSVDKEKDAGKLLSHKAFWTYPEQPRLNATITELIYIPKAVHDGKYFMNIQIASLENDASPSKVLLFNVS